MTQPILLDGDSLTVDAVYRVAVERAPVALSDRGRARVARARGGRGDVLERGGLV